jgi:acyl carrier protein
MGATYHPTVEERGAVAMSMADFFNDASAAQYDLRPEMPADKRYDSCGIDSRGLTRVMLKAEERYEIIIPEEDMDNLKTIGQFADYIEARV